MRPSASLLLGILIGASCWTAAHGNPVYSVTGVAVGSRVNVDSNVSAPMTTSNVSRVMIFDKL